MELKARDLFAGVGWGIAARDLGIEDHGVDSDPGVVVAREANGLITIGSDAALIDGAEGGYRVEIASPPCERFSVTGHRDGTWLVQTLIESARLVASGDVDAAFGRLNRHHGKIGLVLDPMRVLLENHEARHAVWEQVPSVLPIWVVCARLLRVVGWSAVAGCVDAADYSTPQNRRRAVMLARRDGKPALIPACEPRITIGDTFPELPRSWYWRSNYSASGLPGETAEERGRTLRGMHQQSGTITRKAWTWLMPNGEVSSCLPSDSARLQGFPASMVWPGSVGQQRLIIGNAVPVPLARALLKAAVL